MKIRPHDLAVYLAKIFVTGALITQGLNPALAMDPKCLRAFLAKIPGAHQSDLAQYSGQDRGDASAYAKYFAGMDKSMQMKLGLIASSLPTQGIVADMGSGSGKGSADLAQIYPELTVIGVDINPKSVKYAASQYQFPNLAYVVGDISHPVLPPNSIDAAINSSVVHHLTSFSNFDVEKVKEAIAAQTLALKNRGILVVLDFLIPENPNSMVVLDLPTGDGKPSGPVKELSTAALFVKFAHDFKSSVHKSGVPYQKLSPGREGYERFSLDHRTATEFLLRKDYRTDYDAEILEEYTAMTQEDFEKMFTKNGLRILASKPIWNSWIIENRYQGKVFLQDLMGNPLDFPPTKYQIIGEKAQGTGQKFVELASKENSSSRFLSSRAAVHTTSGKTWDLIQRPDPTLDLLPWFTQNDHLFAIFRRSYPRPIVGAAVEPTLTQNHLAGYLTEPITAIQKAEKQGILNTLRENLGPGIVIKEISAKREFLPSPGTIDEKVVGQLVQIEPVQDFVRPNPKTLPFSDSGFIQVVDAERAIQAYQVGGMSDQRGEIHLYHLFQTAGKPLPPWTGLDVASLPMTDIEVNPTPVNELLTQKPVHAFRLESASHAPSFLSLREATFAELDFQDKPLNQGKLEYVTPRNFSRNTVSVIPVLKNKGEVFVGLEERDLPAAQAQLGSSRMYVAPAFRIPKDILKLSAAQKWVQEQAHEHLGVTLGALKPLGGEYFTSPGVTPEMAYPHVAIVQGVSGSSKLFWVRLKDLLPVVHEFPDSHTQTLVLRLSHALEAR